MAPPAVGAVLSGSASTDGLLYGGLVQNCGTFCAGLNMIAALSGNGRRDLLPPFWKSLWKLRGPQRWWRVKTDSMAHAHHIGPGPTGMDLMLPCEVSCSLSYERIRRRDHLDAPGLVATLRLGAFILVLQARR